MRAKTKEEKEMQGTFEPSKEPLDPVQLNAYERSPTPPANWPPSIQKIWLDRCDDLKNTGYLAKAFIPLLRRYCFAVLQAEEAEKHLLDEGFTVTEYGTEGQAYEVMSKWINVLDQANKTIERIGAKFGFSPLDVQKIPAVKKAEGKEMSLFK
jgi:P27 family predicted phage terminase small subunit